MKSCIILVGKSFLLKFTSPIFLTASKDTEETTEEDKWLKFSLAEQIRTEEGDSYNTVKIGEKKKDLILRCISEQWNTLVYGRMRILLGDSISDEE